MPSKTRRVRDGVRSKTTKPFTNVDEPPRREQITRDFLGPRRTVNQQKARSDAGFVDFSGLPWISKWE
jgi:hypothetical protein